MERVKSDNSKTFKFPCGTMNFIAMIALLLHSVAFRV